MHTYRLETYTNRRTGEHEAEVDNEEYRLLNPDFLQIDDQEEIGCNLDFAAYRTHKDPWRSGYCSVNNFILGMYSKSRVTQMIDGDYDYVIFLRPDVRYVQPFDVTWLRLATDTIIVIPRFALYGPQKVNDRFAITNNSTYNMYGEMFDELLPLSKTEPMHSETLIGMILTRRSLTLRRVPFVFVRIRCKGNIELGDVKFNRA